MNIAIGERIGDYEFLEVINSSRSELAYKVRNVIADRFELLRVLPQPIQDDPERVERFLREIKVHARLSHPNVVAFHNATRLQDKLVMTTEFVEGVTLEEKLALGPLPVKQAIDCIAQVLAALDHAHEHGIVHREVTPAHIILLPGGLVKLAGFGLAKAATDPQLTQAGTMLGSLHYASPEQVRGVGPLDGRADIYSAGVVLYEAVTGRKPFDARSQFDLMLAQVKATPELPSQLNPEVPEKLDRIISTAMAKQPEERFRTAREFRSLLETLKLAMEVRSGASDPETWEYIPQRQAPSAPPAAAVLTAAAGEGRRSITRSLDLKVAGLFAFLLLALALCTLLLRGKP